MNPSKAALTLACALSMVAARAQAQPGSASPNASPIPASTLNSTPYAGEQSRPTKALSEREADDLRSGRGMGLSKAAELNHRPGPRHVLDLADQLALSHAQRTEVQAVFDRMDRDAKALGAMVIDRERALDARLVQGDFERLDVERWIEEIARLQARLRFTHIDAHLHTARVMTQPQIAAYDRLRGYDGGGGGAIHDHSH